VASTGVWFCPMTLADESKTLLDVVVEKRAGGHHREGQVDMLGAVSNAIDEQRHLMVEAGTGTGKSFAYLIPAVASGEKVVISTATKSLQDQLGDRDLPFIAEALKGKGVRFKSVVIKGRSSYLCHSRLKEQLSEAGWSDQTDLFASDELTGEVHKVKAWSEETETGDRDALPFEVQDWADYSVSGMECPGRVICPEGDICFAFKAHDRAEDADVIVVNHHLYGMHLSADSSILPEHRVVVFDEAHRLEDTMASALGAELAGWRMWQLTRAATALRAILPTTRATSFQRRLAAATRRFEEDLKDTPQGRFRNASELNVAESLVELVELVTAISTEVRDAKVSNPAFLGAKARIIRLIGHLLGDLGMISDLDDGVVGWVEGGLQPALKAAPVDVGDLLQKALLNNVTTIGTSATLSLGGSLDPVASRLGLGRDGHTYDAKRVRSPFDFDRQSLFYVAADLPKPSHDDWPAAVNDTIAKLVSASGGRALLLATSHRMLREMAEALRDREFTLLVQGEMPKQALVKEFEEDETSVLVATMGFWEGLDVPGRSLQLVVIDKLPFPRPNDPLWQARREAAEASRQNPFMTVDLPRAAMLLAQGAGRLIRTVDDLGVVALLDPRLVTARYGTAIRDTLPPMPVTSDLAEAASFLRRAANEAGQAAPSNS
jgi:ATP-dependent DNA helicase DinG